MKIEHYQNLQLKYMGWNDRLKENRIQIKDMRFNKIIYIPYKTNIITDVAEFLGNRGYEVIGYSANYDETYNMMVKSSNNIFMEVRK